MFKIDTSNKSLKELFKKAILLLIVYFDSSYAFSYYESLCWCVGNPFVGVLVSLHLHRAHAHRK